MKSKIALGTGLLATGALAFGLMTSGEAAAQPVLPYYPGVGVYAAPGLPPQEVVAIVRSTGLEPLSGPMRHGPTYALRAVDPSGREFRVIVDARFGRVLRAVPLPGPRYAVPVVPPYGRAPGPVAMAPDGYGPNSRIAALPPGVGGPQVNGPGVAGVPGAPGHAPAVGTAPRPGVQAGPPLPRPRPKIAATNSSAPIDTPLQASPSQAAPSQGVIKETADTTGAVTPPAPPAVTLPAAPAPAPEELHE